MLDFFHNYWSYFEHLSQSNLGALWALETMLTCQSCHVQSEKACSSYHLLWKSIHSPWFLLQVQGESWPLVTSMQDGLHWSLRKEKQFKSRFWSIYTLTFKNFIWNSGNEGQSTKPREHWSNKKVLGGSFVCTGLCLIWTAMAEVPASASRTHIGNSTVFTMCQVLCSVFVDGDLCTPQTPLWGMCYQQNPNYRSPQPHHSWTQEARGGCRTWTRTQLTSAGSGVKPRLLKLVFNCYSRLLPEKWPYF